MALHGPIQVNQTEIGYWEAVRKDAVTDDDYEPVVYRYACQVEIYERGNWKGEVTHRYREGAVVLLAKILVAAAPEIPQL